MTQASSGPQTGQAAPPNPDYGFSAPHQNAPQHSAAGSAPSSAWSPGAGSPGGFGTPGTSNPGAFGGAATADSPTGALPAVQPGQPGPPPAGPASPVGAPGGGSASAVAAPGKARAARNRGPRRARLQLRHINPWTVLKFSCVLSVALFFVWLIVVGVLYGILDGAGIIGKINDTVTTIQGGDAQDPVTAGVVFGGAAIIGVVNVVLFIALSTIGSLVYNLCADLVGGIEITLSER